MGGASSSLGSPTSLSERAKLGKKLPDEILNIFFNSADYRDLLSLSSLERCPAYMFTTASALSTMFQRLQVAPTLGSKGEILFAPLSTLSPGLDPKAKESDQQLRQKSLQRDVMCMEVAYFYVRIFQIYAALSLSVMEADPVRRSRIVPQARGGPQRAIFTGGAHGGALASTGANKKLTDQVKASLFAPLIKYFTWNIYQGNINLMKFDDPVKGQPGTFNIRWEAISPGQNRLTSYYITNNQNFPEEVIITYEQNEAALKFASTQQTIMEFVKNTVTGVWSVDPDLGEEQAKREASEIIHENFKKYLTEQQEKREAKAASSSSGSSSSSSSSSGLGLVGPSAGKSSFEGFKEIKEVFEKRFKGGEFPKAYCIGRAMTLLMPIFDAEKLDKAQPYYSQICRKKFDFESEEFMPKPGKRPNANIYFKSLVSLFYDDYRLSEKGVEFIQTETGRTDLRTASKQLANLYNITSKPEEFIESSSEFKAFPICGNEDVLFQVDEKFRQVLLKSVVNPMIALQEEHTKNVNNLLKEMFDVRGGQMKFTQALKTGGKAGVNAFGRRAASLLLNYYKKSEAYFIKGVLMFENSEYKPFYKKVI